MGRLPPGSTPRGADVGTRGPFHDPLETVDLANQPDEALDPVGGEARQIAGGRLAASSRKSAERVTISARTRRPERAAPPPISPQREADESGGCSWVCLEATASLRMAALSIALLLIVHYSSLRAARARRCFTPVGVTAVS
jgi:hypothetical protein